MDTRDDLLEALHHATATRARLKQQPGTHGQAAVMATIDAILDQLTEWEAECSPAYSSSALR